MKIVALDAGTLPAHESNLAALYELGDVVFHDHTRPEEVPERICDATIVLTNKCILTSAVLQDARQLRMISVLATGTNNVDLVAARELEIVVSNVPAYSTESVTQHTLALILALTNRVGEHSTDVHQGGWVRSEHFSYELCPMVDLAGKTLAVVGFGTIGRRVAEVARAIGMDILAVSRSRNADPHWENFRWASMEEAFEKGDVVSLHCALTTETLGLVDANRLRSMKPGAFLINTARGPLVDEPSLAEALRSGVIAGAALDVISCEPMSSDNPLLGVPNLILTPHLAWRGPSALRKLCEETVRNVQAFLDRQPRNVVNAKVETSVDRPS